MARKATRLRFTEDELANPKIKKAASKAEKLPTKQTVPLQKRRRKES